MRKHLRYGWYVLRHKWFVFLECLRVGIPLRGLLHDWSKLLPDEWLPYARFFYGGPHLPRARWDAYGKANHPNVVDRLCIEGVQAAFDEAWRRHQRRSDHHWQAWLLHEDSGELKVLEMSDGARREMICDWRGCGRALGKPDVRAWYADNWSKMLLAPETRRWVEHELAERP